LKWLSTVVDAYCGQGRGFGAALPAFALEWVETNTDDPVRDPLLLDPVMVDLNINENLWTHINAALTELWLSPITEISYVESLAKLKVFSVFLQFVHCHIAQTQYSIYCSLRAERKKPPEILDVSGSSGASAAGAIMGGVSASGAIELERTYGTSSQLEANPLGVILAKGNVPGNGPYVDRSSKDTLNSPTFSSAFPTAKKVDNDQKTLKIEGTKTNSSSNKMESRSAQRASVNATSIDSKTAATVNVAPASSKPTTVVVDANASARLQETPCRRYNIIGVITADGNFSPRERAELPTVPHWAKSSIFKYAQRWGVPYEFGLVYRAFLAGSVTA
jgi:hypothetical protein